MKRTQWVALFQDIKGTAVSFLSIMLFVALGIAVFLGIKWNDPALTNTTTAYYDAHSFHDLALSFAYGFTQEDVEKVQALEAVAAAEGAYSAHGTTWVGDKRYVLAIQSLTEQIDTTDTLSGALPVNAGEVGVERLFAEAAGLQIGDTLSIDTGSGKSARLSRTELTITGIVEHPSYIRPETQTRGMSNIGDGTVNYYIVAPKAAFQPEAYDNCFSQIVIRGVGLTGMNTFGSAYETRSAAVAEQLRELGRERAPLRSDAVFARYSSEIAQGEEKLRDAEGELIDGRKAYAEGREKVDEARQELTSGERTYNDSARQLAEGERTYAANLAIYKENEDKLKSGRSKLVKQLRAAGFSTSAVKARTEITNKLDDLNGTRAQLAQLREVLDQLVNNQGDPISIDEQTLGILIKELSKEGFGFGPTVAEIESKRPAALSALDAYIADPNDEPKRLAAAPYMTRAGLSVTVDSAKEVRDSLSDAVLNPIFSKFHTDPSSLTGGEIAKLVIAMKSLGVKFDLSGVDALIAAKRAEVSSNIGLLDDGIGKLYKLLRGVNEYLKGARHLGRAKQELEAAAQLIEESREALKEGKLKLDTSRQDFAAAEQELSDAGETLSDGEAAFAESKATLEKAKADLSVLDRFGSWTLQKRTDNPGCAIAKGASEATRKLCYSMALLFVFVGLMVCYTSVSRIVNESQIMTGVQKALGFRNKEIVTHYLIYSVLAVTLGALLGGALGYYGIESLVNASYARNFVFDRISNVFSWKDLLTITAVELILICLATWFPCRKLLKRQAVDLLRGDNHSGGRTRFYEKMPFWEKCSLYTQTTVNNLVNDSSRVIASLVGVAGCTALIVMALSSQLCLVNTPVQHFDHVWRYDARLVSDNRMEGAQESLRAALDKEPVSYTPALQEAVFIEAEDGTLSKADLIVPEEPEKLDSFVGLRDYRSKQPLRLTEEGALVSRTYARYHHVQAGSTLRLMDTKGKYHQCVVAGVTEHYLSTNQLVMSRAYYEQVMETPAVSNTFYVNCGEGTDPALLEKKLEDVNGYFSLTNENAKWTAVFEATFKSTSLVVYICLFLSAAMALLVLLNLNVVFINEKAKELIIMRINGFSIRATKRYIYRDNIVLTILGILLGIAVGLVLAAWVLGNLQRAGDNFYTAPNLTACLIGAGLSGLFSLITNLIALKRVDRLKVSDIGRM